MDGLDLGNGKYRMEGIARMEGITRMGSKR